MLSHEHGMVGKVTSNCMGGGCSKHSMRSLSGADWHAAANIGLTDPWKLQLGPQNTLASTIRAAPSPCMILEPYKTLDRDRLFRAQAHAWWLALTLMVMVSPRDVSTTSSCTVCVCAYRPAATHGRAKVAHGAAQCLLC